MIRFLFFVIILFGLGFVVQQGAQDSGEAVIRWHGYEVRMQATFLAFAVLSFCLVFFFGGQLWAFLMQAPHTFERWRYKRKYEQGFSYFLEGLEALSAGENKQAERLANKVQKLLPDERLSNLLSADAASLTGKNVKAIEHYKTLAKSDKGQFIGLKGLMEQFKQKGEWENLNTYAKQAFLLKPKNTYVVDNLFESYLHTKNFKEAINLIPNIQKYGSHTSEYLDENEAFMYIHQSEQVEEKEAIKLLEKALKVQKNCVPAIQKLITFIQKKDPKKALKLIHNFFGHTGNMAVYDLWVTVIRTEHKKYYKRRLKALLKGREKTFLYSFIQGKEALRLEENEKALEYFKEAKERQTCSQVNILIAQIANDLGADKAEINKTLNNLSKDKNYVFEGTDIIEAYVNWNSTYIESDSIELEVPNKGLNLLGRG